MADTTALKNRIRAAIKANDNQEITGPVLQQTLLDMVDELNNEEALQQILQAVNTEKTRAEHAEQSIEQKADTSLYRISNLEIVDVTGTEVLDKRIILLRTAESGAEEYIDLSSLELLFAKPKNPGLVNIKALSLFGKSALVLQTVNYAQHWARTVNKAGLDIIIDFIIVPSNNNYFKDISCELWDGETLIGVIGYYENNNNKLYIGKSGVDVYLKYYKRYRARIVNENGSLKFYLDGTLYYTSPDTANTYNFYLNRISQEPIGDMFIYDYVVKDNTGVDNIKTLVANGTLTSGISITDDSIFSDVEMMRSEQFDQIGPNQIKWIDGTIGSIISLVYDDDSLGISSYQITYKDYVVTQPTITYNSDYQISNKPEIVITKSN